MIVDDRLDTVLHTPAAGQVGLGTQWRQLIDILGRTPDADWSHRQTQALARLDALHAELGDAAAAILTRHCTLPSVRLIAHLAGLGPRTAQAAIDRARLTDAQWLQLVPGLPVQARGALRHRRDLSPPVTALLERLGIDDLVLTGPPVPPPAAAASPADAVVSLPAEPAHRAATLRDGQPAAEAIGAIVRRIEAFRRTRQDPARAAPGQTRLPFGDDAAIDPPAIAVDIAVDAAGMIVAAEGVDPALLVGHWPFVLATPAAAASADAATVRAFAARQPIVAGHVAFDGAPRIAGTWRIDAVPHFGADGGQFAGYRARLRRPPRAARASDAAGAGHGGGDVLQQVLHELRTPINAIQGFAELIQQQVLGPTPHHYRSLAASIAADAARMLAGFEDVERLVRLESGRARVQAGQCELVAITTRLVAQLQPLVIPRGIALHWTPPAAALPAAIDPAEAESLIWRLLATLTGAAAPGEAMTLALTLLPDATAARLTITLPRALAGLDEDALFAPDVARGANRGIGMLGHGFALRLVRAEIRAAGGRLVRAGAPERTVLDMTLPIIMPHVLDRDRAASQSVMR